MRLAACAAVAAVVPALLTAQIIPQLTPDAGTYSIDARSVAVFSVDVPDVPVAPACGSVCPKEGYMVCSGKCPAGCYCADGWGIYVDVDTDTPEGSDTNPTGLSLAVADQAPDPAARNSATAFAKYAATAEWSILPFVTLFTHTEDVANSRKRSSSREVYGLVDLCKTTAEAGGATPVGTNQTLECSCDGCGDTCGVPGSRKSKRCLTDRDAFEIEFSGCTYYASGDALSGPARDAAYCCNAVPAAFEDYIGAISQHQHFHDFKSPPKTHFAAYRESSCNTTTGESTGSYELGQLAVSRCLSGTLAPGTYYLYVVNTDDAPQDIKLSYTVTSISRDEAMVCFGNRFDGTVIGEGGAARATCAIAGVAALAAVWAV